MTFLVRVAWFGAILAASLTSAWAQQATDGRFEARGRPKVIGGDPTSRKEWPAQAVLRYYDPADKKSGYVCGGSVIAPHWVLTAAHCLVVLQAAGTLKGAYSVGSGNVERSGVLQVVLGVDNLNYVGPGNVYEPDGLFVHEGFLSLYQTAIARSFAHPLDYSTLLSGNDIALVKLKRAWDGEIARLSLAAETDTLPGSDVLIAGFGDVELVSTERGLKTYKHPDGTEYFAATQQLQNARLPLVDTADCSARYKKRQGFADAIIGPGQLCAGTETDKRDTCQGDSGGPLVGWDRDNRKYQIGIVSWGQDCAIPGVYGVYTRVSAHASWLRKHAGELRAVQPALVAATNPSKPDPNKARFIEAALGQLQDEIGPPQGRVRITVPLGSRVRLGEHYNFEVESKLAGRLLIIDIDADHKVTPIFPNEFVRSARVGRIEAGQKLTVPAKDGSWGFPAFAAAEPLGRSKLVALVVPESFPIETTLAATETLKAGSKGFVPVPPAGYFMNVLDHILKTKAKFSAPAESWAWAVFEYEIVPR